MAVPRVLYSYAGAEGARVKGTLAGCCWLKQNIPRQRTDCSGSSSHAAVAHVMLLLAAELRGPPLRLYSALACRSLL